MGHISNRRKLKSGRFLTPHKFLTLGLGVALSLSVASVSMAAELKARLEGAVNIVDPAFWQSTQEAHVINAIFPKLIEYKSTANDGLWEWEKQLAKTIEQVDATTIKFELKPGYTWTGDYGEITAEDVKYSFERYLNKELDSPNKGDWVSLKEVEVTGKYSGIIHLKEAFAPLWTSTLPYLGGAIVSKAATESVGGKFTIDPVATGGAYKISNWVPREKIELVIHEGWKGKKPGFDKITLFPISDLKSAEIAFDAGELDFSAVSIGSVFVLSDNLSDKDMMEVRPSLDYLWLGLNEANPALKDVRVRQAIKKAIDVEAILEGAYFGIPKRSTGLSAPGLIGYREANFPPRDVAGAIELLEEAGASGLTLELEVNNNTDRVTSAQIIQANLAEIGINLKINILDGGSFWSLGDTKGEEMQMTLKSYTNPPDPAWGTQWFLADQKGVWNWEWFDNPKFEKLHYQGLAENDADARDAIYKEMQDIMDESGAFIWLMHPPEALIYNSDVKPGLYPNGRPKYIDFEPAN